MTFNLEVNHVAEIHENTVQLWNEGDSYYIQTFNNAKELDEFIAYLQQLRNEVWPT